MYPNFFIYSSFSGRLGCFHVLAIINSPVMSIEVYVSFSVMETYNVLKEIPSTWKNRRMQTGQRSLDPKPSWKHRLPGLQTYVSFYGKGRVTGIKIPISGARAADSLYLEAGLDSNQGRVSHSPWASITEYHKLSGLINRTFLQFKVKAKVWADSAPGKRLPLDWQRAIVVISHDTQREKEKMSVILNPITRALAL